MKHFLIMITIFSLLLCVCSCKNNASDTQWWEDTTTQSTGEQDSAQSDPIQHLYGEWKNEQGEREIIDADTVGGSRYTVESVDVNEYGNVTVKVCIGSSHVTYTVFRYTVGYAEYSYMEALMETKGITIIYTK